MWVINEQFGRSTSHNPTMLGKRRFRDALAGRGARVVDIPGHWAHTSDASTVLARVAPRASVEPAVLNGAIHTPDEYAELYEACAARNLRLLNRPEQYARAHSLEQAYPLLRELTPETLFATSPGQLGAVVAALGLPVFVKGAVQALKGLGWSSCAARTQADVERIADALWDDHDRSGGVVAVRRLVRLRHRRSETDGFPVGREFRVFLYRDEPLACGYYWKGDDELAALGDDERATVLSLARRASERLGVPYVAVDVGQLEDGSWVVIECGDAQFCGYCQVDIGELAGELAAAVDR